MNLTKQELIEILFSDGDYYNHFTEDAAKDFFHTTHKKMKKAELIETVNKKIENSQYMRQEKERLIKQKEEEKREAKA